MAHSLPCLPASLPAFSLSCQPKKKTDKEWHDRQSEVSNQPLMPSFKTDVNPPVVKVKKNRHWHNTKPWEGMGVKMRMGIGKVQNVKDGSLMNGERGDDEQPTNNEMMMRRKNRK